MAMPSNVCGIILKQIRNSSHGGPSHVAQIVCTITIVSNHSIFI